MCTENWCGKFPVLVIVIVQLHNNEATHNAHLDSVDVFVNPKLLFLSLSVACMLWDISCKCKMASCHTCIAVVVDVNVVAVKQQH